MKPQKQTRVWQKQIKELEQKFLVLKDRRVPLGKNIKKVPVGNNR